MTISKDQRLITINQSLQQIADITLEITMSSASDENKQKQIAPHMAHHKRLTDEAFKLLNE